MTEVEQVVDRWRRARAWQPQPRWVERARRAEPRAWPKGWPGFPAEPFSLDPPPSPAAAPHLLAAYALYDRLNAEHFDPRCPPVKIVINPRLRSTGGRIETRLRVLELNQFRLLELPETLEEILFHEMIHLWLYTQGFSAGHTPAFRAKMAERGHTSIHYGVEGDPKGARHAYPGSDRRVIYRCPHCGHTYQRRQQFRQAMLCGRCLRGGQGRHRLVLAAILRGEDPR